ncbi:MAG: hypothetical protein ACK53Y_08615 [bacterium]
MVNGRPAAALRRIAVPAAALAGYLPLFCTLYVQTFVNTARTCFLLESPRRKKLAFNSSGISGEN